jgi:hypothetical protein
MGGCPATEQYRRPSSLVAITRGHGLLRTKFLGEKVFVCRFECPYYRFIASDLPLSPLQ